MSYRYAIFLVFVSVPYSLGPIKGLKDIIK